MSIKNNETKLLFDDFEDEENKKSDGEMDFCVKCKDLGLNNNRSYYCYFYEKKNGEKDFVFDQGHVPKIRQNVFKAYHVNYNCNKDCVGLRFFVADKEIENNKAKDMSPGKNKDVTWYEVKQDENGQKYIAKLGLNETEWQKTDIAFAYSDDYFRNKKRWKIGPYEKYGDQKFLTHFNHCSSVYIKCDKFKQLISNDINSLEFDADNTEFNPNVYACVKLHPDGDFYLDWSGNMKENLEKDSGTANSHNGYMEDMYTLRFYVTKKILSINAGGKFDENTLFDKNDKISVFEVRRDKNNNIILWHLKDKEKNEWEAVDGEIQYKEILPDYLATGGEYYCISKLSYFCKTQLTNDIQTSYTVEVYEGSEKIGKNTVEINNTGIVDQTFNLEKTKTDECKVKAGESKTKVKSNYHICKTILFSLLAIGVGFLFGWIYALIPIALLIVLAILDHKFNFLPEPKTIFCCFRSCLNSNRKIEEKEKSPEQNKNINKEETQIEK